MLSLLLPPESTPFLGRQSPNPPCHFPSAPPALHGDLGSPGTAWRSWPGALALQAQGEGCALAPSL